MREDGFHCLDRQRSVYIFFPGREVALSIEKLVLDERVLALTPPPEGIWFVPVDRWSDSAGFQAAATP
jgi:hypothetical protein